jgi:hypothetical protein
MEVQANNELPMFTILTEYYYFKLTMQIYIIAL